MNTPTTPDPPYVPIRGMAARAAAGATLTRDLGKLDAERATIYSILRSAEHAVSDQAALPKLPG